MTNQAFPSVDGVESSWAEINVTLNVQTGLTLTAVDMSEIKWSRKVDVATRQGISGGNPTKRTRGSVTNDASIVFYRSGLSKFEDALADVAPMIDGEKKISLVVFNVLIVHTPIGSSDIFSTSLEKCRYLGDTDDSKEGQEADTIEVPIPPMKIVRLKNGKRVALL